MSFSRGIASLRRKRTHQGRLQSTVVDGIATSSNPSFQRGLHLEERSMFYDRIEESDGNGGHLPRFHSCRQEREDGPEISGHEGTASSQEGNRSLNEPSDLMDRDRIEERENSLDIRQHGERETEECIREEKGSNDDLNTSDPGFQDGENMLSSADQPEDPLSSAGYVFPCHPVPTEKKLKTTGWLDEVCIDVDIDALVLVSQGPSQIPNIISPECTWQIPITCREATAQIKTASPTRSTIRLQGRNFQGAERKGPRSHWSSVHV